MTPEAVMIFGAGLGTRMGAMTRNRPKPLIPVAGKALIDHALDLTGAVSPTQIVVNVHYLAPQMRDHLAGRDVAVSDETDQLLETGGGLRQAGSLLGPGPVFALNSDAVWRGANPLVMLQDGWDPARMEALLLLVARQDAVGHRGRGDFLLDDAGRLTRGAGSVYTGAQIIRTEGLQDFDMPAFSLNLLWDRMAERGGLFGIVYTGQWCDVGAPESIPLAEAMLAAADV